MKSAYRMRLQYELSILQYLSMIFMCMRYVKCSSIKYGYEGYCIKHTDSLYH